MRAHSPGRDAQPEDVLRWTAWAYENAPALLRVAEAADRLDEMNPAAEGLVSGADEWKRRSINLHTALNDLEYENA
jgi:hypothetical protein